MNEIIYNFSQYYRDSSPLNIMIAGTSYCDRTYHIERNDSNILSFEYILEGKGTLEINGKTFHPQKNDVYLLTKHSNHRYYSDAKDPWKKVWIVFNGSFGEFLFDHYIPDETYLVRNCNISIFMAEIMEIIRSGVSYELLVDQVMVILLKMAQSIKNHLIHLNVSTASAIEQWISANVNNKISIEQICTNFSYSKNHIINVFKQEYDITPFQYYKAKRVEAARQYLTHTNLSIKQIAVTMNFPDRYYFENYFKKNTGLSPRKFRKNLNI